MIICFYADLYFMLNLIINVFLLYITAYLKKQRIKVKRCLTVSVIFAVVSTYSTYIYYRGILTGVLFLTVSLLEVVFILITAYRPQGFRGFCSYFFVFIGVAVFISGVLLMIRDRFSFAVFEQNKTMSFVAVIISLSVIMLVFMLFRRMIVWQISSQKRVTAVTLFCNGKNFEIKALYDTGNQLVSPYTGEPVTIISQYIYEKAGIGRGKAPILIPYHSIGGDGLLKAYRIDGIKVEGEGIKRNILVAVSENLCVDKEIQMILNV